MMRCIQFALHTKSSLLYTLYLNSPGWQGCLTVWVFVIIRKNKSSNSKLLFLDVTRIDLVAALKHQP